jgi:hypothetical protein
MDKYDVMKQFPLTNWDGNSLAAGLSLVLESVK